MLSQIGNLLDQLLGLCSTLGCKQQKVQPVKLSYKNSYERCLRALDGKDSYDVASLSYGISERLRLVFSQSRSSAGGNE
jgi:hypothetical protein